MGHMCQVLGIGVCTTPPLPYCTAMLHCTPLCYATLYCMILYCTVPHYTILLCYTVLLCHTVVYCTVLYYTLLYSTPMLYCTALHRSTGPHCTVLHCTHLLHHPVTQKETSSELCPGCATQTDLSCADILFLNASLLSPWGGQVVPGAEALGTVTFSWQQL